MRQKWSQLYEFQAVTYIKEENPGPIPPNNKDLRRPQCTEVEPPKNDDENEVTDLGIGEHMMARSYANTTAVNLTFTGPCIVIYFYSKTN